MCKTIFNLAIATLCALGGSARGEGYNIRELPLLPGAISSQAYGVSDTGDAVGQVRFSDGRFRPVLWRNDTVLDLFPSTSTLNGYAAAISHDGTIVGTSDEGIARAFVWQSGLIRSLTNDDQQPSSALAISNSGIVAGNMSTKGGYFAARSAGTNLQSIPGARSLSQAYAVNDRGFVAGTVFGNNENPVAFTFGDNVYIEFRPEDVEKCFALDVNNLDQVALRTFAGGRLTGMILEDGALHTLRPLPKDVETDGYRLNDVGQIVGSSFDQSLQQSHVVVWENYNSLPVNLQNRIIGSTNLLLEGATGINNLGQIVGDAFDPDTGQTRAYILTPVVPEPNTLVPLATGTLLCIRRRAATCVR